MNYARLRVLGRFSFGFGLLALGLPLLAATGPIATKHVRGTISSVSATSLAISTADGSVKVAIDPKTAYIGVTPATAVDIKPGTFIGTTNVQRNGQNQAVEVHIFPESMRGLAEGDYSWDLPSAHHGSAMTNGTVGGSQHSMMTNGTVANGMMKPKMPTDAVPGERTIHVGYKGGSKEIVISADAKIVKFSAATKSVATNGTHVLVIGAANGSTIQAKAVVAGENGLIPPM
ncbi:MAG: metal ABC transporter permease [Candidatus Eremiobacteraeota bacterium]|nr:metal ABC transporter permease [Candidatus Eremiobacteraeota bacterium]